MEAPPNSSSTASPSSGETRRKYKGLRRRKWGRWVSEIRLPNSRERIWLVSYDTPEKAARAFDAAFVCLRGTGGGADGLNFPGSSPPDVGRTSDPAKMCAAAESHANCAAVPPPPDATDGGAPPGTAAAAPAPALAPAATALQVSIPSSDWSELLLDSQQPLFSPTSETWSHPYLLAAAAADVDMEETKVAHHSRAFGPFDSIGGSRH